MKERERIIVTGLVFFMLLFWLGFLVHRSPRFAGSFWGGVLAIIGSLLMLIPLFYTIVKRVPFVKKAVKEHISMRTLLTWHIYAGILGPILVLAHTGHKFESPLGIALTAMTIIVVMSGYVGRYLMNLISKEIKEKKAMLNELQISYKEMMSELADNPQEAPLIQPFSGFFSRVISFFLPTQKNSKIQAIISTTEAIADVEYAIKTHEKFKHWFAKWLHWHIVISIVLYILMALHVAAAIHFGLRWFE